MEKNYARVLIGEIFCNGLFFEFVQRQQGYRGFGAANAPFRLAAQRRQTRTADGANITIIDQK